MINGMYLSTMGAMVQGAQHGLLANNLANVDTTGYKPDYGTFRELLAESALQPGWRPEVNELLEKTGGGAWLNETATGFHQGPLRVTEDPYNVSITDQNGFFRVMRGEEEFLTRDGAFTLDGEGVLVMADGTTPVLDEGGAQIQLDAPARIMPGGMVVDEATGEEIAQLGLTRVDDVGMLKKQGDNLFALGEAQMVEGPVGLRPGTVEESAVDPVREMTAMIEAMRSYEANMRFISMQDTTLGQTVSRVGSVR
jgi:flagellar basal body rod protein FlgG